MKPVDYNAKEHAGLIAKALDIFRYPHNCKLTGRTREALVSHRLAAGDLLDAARVHLGAKLPLYTEMQTMYDNEPSVAHIICPLMIGTVRLFFKYWLPKVDREIDERMCVSSHDPEYPCPGDKP